MLNIKNFKKLITHIVIVGLLQMQFNMGVMLFNISNVSYAETVTPGVNERGCDLNQDGKVDESETVKCKTIEGINTTTKEWVVAANERKQNYSLPPSEIKRLEKQAALNAAILSDNEALINKFYSALSALGIDAMGEAAANIELLTSKLKTETTDLKNHTQNELEPAIDNFKGATSIPLIPPVGAIVGGVAWLSTAPKANSESDENDVKANQLFNTSNQLWDAVDKMVEVDNASYNKAIQLAQATKAEAINLLKKSVNDSFELTGDAVDREFEIDMLTNTDILGVSTAACLDLDCSNLGDAFSVSYHLFKAASAVYLSTKVRLISAYNENQNDIMNSKPNEEDKFDAQTEHIMIAENVRTESVDFGDKIKAAKSVLEKMWARVLQVAQLEVRQKEARAEAEQAQGGSGDGAAQALDDAAEKKADFSKASKDWIGMVLMVAGAGMGMCCGSSPCVSMCPKNAKYWAMGLGLAGLLWGFIKKSDDAKTQADDALQDVNDRAGGGGGGGGGGESAKHTKLACKAAGANLYVSEADLKILENEIIASASMIQKFDNLLNKLSLIDSAYAEGKKITSALGLKTGSDIYNLFVQTKKSEAADMSGSFGEPESRVSYLSGIVSLASQGADESDTITNPNLKESQSKTGNLTEDMKIFGSKKDVGSKEDLAIDEQKNIQDNDSANISQASKISGMSSSGSFNLKGNSKLSAMRTSEKGAKTKSMKGGDYLRKLAGKLNALGDSYRKQRDENRIKLGLTPIKEQTFDQAKFDKEQNAKRIKVLESTTAIAGSGAGLQDLLSQLKGDPKIKTEDDEKNTDYAANMNNVDTMPSSTSFPPSSSMDSSLGNANESGDKNGTGQDGALTDVQSKEYLDVEQYEKSKKAKDYDVKEEDTLWSKITKTYQKIGYPILMKKKKSIDER